ncbi:hypothetical protein ABC255_23280 [Neobacillus sp. 3P2-tot-E-2]|uniref:hypothetical protein n=1 Tax=Neobacillus sp. 3P2-tot-E-2 TaxID=3132212 RepID=UPI00399FA852
MNNLQLMKFRLRQMEKETNSTLKEKNTIVLAVEKMVSAIKYLLNIKNRFQ